MDKVGKIGLVVSIGLLIAWFLYQSDLQRREAERRAAEMPPEVPTTPVVDDVPRVVPEPEPAIEVDLPEPDMFPEDAEVIEIETDFLKVELSNWGGVIKRVVLKENEKAGIRKLPDEESGDVVLVEARTPADAPGALTAPPVGEMEWERSGNRVEFHSSDERIRVRKTYEFFEGHFEARLRIEIENISEENILLPDGLVLSAGSITTIDDGDILGVDALSEDQVVRNRTPIEKTSLPIDWTALKTTYFTFIINPLEVQASAVEIGGRRIGAGVNQALLGCAPGPQYEELSAALYFDRFANLPPAGAAELDLKVYFGPADYRILRGYDSNYERVIDFGFWAPISRVIIWSLTELYNLLGSYGWAIIILTVIIRIVLWPLTHKSAKSMKGMQKVQPLVAGLKEKYKSDPKKLQAETMKLYKEHGVNPMGGCLPMVLQIPILFAFFTSLRGAILLRKAPFWIIPGRWIQDLSGPDVLMTLERPLPILGNNLNILPILMGISFLIQQKYTPTAAATPEAEKQQKMMAILMPVMFIFIFYSLPSGLNLYFLVSNVLSLPQQIMAVRKR